MRRQLLGTLGTLACALLVATCNKPHTSAPAAAAVPAPRVPPPALAKASDPRQQASENVPAIRGANLKEFLGKHLAELNPELADLETDCGEGKAPIQSLAPTQYGDLDGDGQEEAAVEGWSCLSGNGGADFFGVLKLRSDGQMVVLPIEHMPKSFNGRDPYEGLRGHLRLEINNGRLVEVYPVYADQKACNSCSDGERRFEFRWNGQEFILDDIVDVPPQT